MVLHVGIAMQLVLSQKCWAGSLGTASLVNSPTGLDSSARALPWLPRPPLSSRVPYRAHPFFTYHQACVIFLSSRLCSLYPSLAFALLSSSSSYSHLHHVHCVSFLVVCSLQFTVFTCVVFIILGSPTSSQCAPHKGLVTQNPFCSFVVMLHKLTDHNGTQVWYATQSQEFHGAWFFSFGKPFSHSPCFHCRSALPSRPCLLY